MDDMDFEFNFCPECGSGDVMWSGTYVMAGRLWRCRSCGKAWHVIWENPEEYEQTVEDDDAD